MDTPKSARQSFDLADTPDTSISNIFDSNDSPLSSACSLSSEYREESPIKTEQAQRQITEPDNDTQDCTTWVNHSLYGDYTAASQRSKRARKKPELFPGLSQVPTEAFKEELEILETNDEATTTPAPDAEEPSAPEQHEEQLQQQATKRKRQASRSDVTGLPTQRRVKGDAAPRRSARAKSDRKATVEGDLLAQSPTRQLRKRKALPATFAVSEAPNAKRAKAATTETAAITKLKPKARNPVASGPARRSTRTTRPPVKLRDFIKEKDTAVSAPRTWILKLKMYDGWRGELKRPSPTSSTTASLQESTSFGSAGKQPKYESQEQCAQPALTPIPASSQLSSEDSSQALNTTSQSQAADPVNHDIQESPHHASPQASQNRAATQPNLSAPTVMNKSQPVQQPSSQVENEVIMGNADLPGSFSALSFHSTQPTLILDKPYSEWSPACSLHS